LAATEYVSLSKSKGEVVVFRQGHAPRKEMISEDKGADVITISSGNETINVDSLAAIQRQVSTLHWEDVVYDIKVRRLHEFVSLHC
jgi:ATP-binding cassette, subfamily G (WHITE), member 2, PDR